MAKDAAEKAEKLEKVEKTEKNDKAEKSSKSEKSDKAAKPEKAEKGKAAKAEHDEEDERDFSYTQNREISWLRFDDRILDEAYDESVPVFERLKFCEIVESNLDEWFMIRVGGLSDLASLKNQPKDNKSNMTPAELGAIAQPDKAFAALAGVYQGVVYADGLFLYIYVGQFPHVVSVFHG